MADEQDSQPPAGEKKEKTAEKEVRRRVRQSAMPDIQYGNWVAEVKVPVAEAMEDALKQLSSTYYLTGLEKALDQLRGLTARG